MRVRSSPDRLIRAARAPTGGRGASSFAGEEGFTITESVTGLAILFVVILALIASITVAVRGILTGRQRSTALAVAEELMEEVRAADYDRIGHKTSAPADATLSTGCAVSGGTAATDVWYEASSSSYRYDDPTTPSQDGETLADGGSYAVVGGTGAPIASHCTTATVDGTPYAAWIYVTRVNPATGDDHKRVTVIVQFGNEQYDKTTVENRAKVSSLVFPSTAADTATITADADTTAGTLSLTGDPGGPFGSLQITFPEADGTLRSSFVDELTGNVTSAWAQLDGGSSGASASGDCTDSGSVATCPAATVATANDDLVSSAPDEYTSTNGTGAVGTLGSGPIGTMPWEGGTVSSQQSACHGLGVTGGVDCGAAFGGAADGLPRGFHVGSGPDDLNVPMGGTLPQGLGSLPLSGSWAGFSGAFQSSADLDQNVLSASKQTTPTASLDAPAVDLVTINDPTGLLGSITVVEVGSVSVDAAAPVGALMGDAAVTASSVTFTVAGNPLAIPTTTPGSGANHTVAPQTTSLGLLEISYEVSVRTGNTVEDETRDGSTVTNSRAELNEILVVVVDVQVTACAAGLPLPDPFDDLCDGVTPTTIMDAAVTMNYGGVVAEGTHKDVA